MLLKIIFICSTLLQATAETITEPSLVKYVDLSKIEQIDKFPPFDDEDDLRGMNSNKTTNSFSREKRSFYK